MRRRTGTGSGARAGNFKYRNRRDRTLDSKSAKSLILLAITSVVQDLLREDSKIKYVVNRLFKPRQLTEHKVARKEIVEAEYKIIDGEKHE